MTTIQKALYLSEFVANNSLILLAIVTSYFYKDCYRTFPQRIEEIQKRTQIYQRKEINQQTTQRIERNVTLVTLFGALFYTATLYMDFFYNSKNVALFLRSSTVYILPNITISFVIGQYWVLIRIATFRYRILNTVLEDLHNRRTRRTTPYPLLAEVLQSQSKPSWDAGVILDDLRNIFVQLDTLVDDINNAFGLTITTNFLASFLTLSIEIFVLYKISDRWTESLWALLLYTILWILLHTVKFIFILKVNSHLLDEKAKTGTILSGLDVRDTQTEDAISRFLFQLVVKKSVHMACGMIDLDMAFVGGVLSGLSIYVIFLIQVDLGEVSLIARAASNATSHVTTPRSIL